MRAAVLTGLLLFAACPARAESFAVLHNARQPQRLALPSQDMLAGHYAARSEKADWPLLGRDAARAHFTQADSGFSIGPFHAEAGKTMGLGRKPHMAPHYRIEGLRVMGGTVGGTIDGRGALFTLHWSE
jgi:hypothetical protein